MKKNAIMAVVCSLVVLGGYIFYMGRNNPNEQNANETKTAVAEQTAEAATDSETSAAEQVTEIPDAELTAAEEENEILEEEFIEVKTGKVYVKFTNKGGDVVDFQLIEHEDKTSESGKVQMASADKEIVSDDNRAFALNLGTGKKAIVNDFFAVEQTGTEGSLQTVVFTKNYKDFTLTKTYSFMPEDYMFKLNISIKGKEGFNGLAFDGSEEKGGKVAYTLRTAPQIGPYFDTRYDFRDFLFHNNSKVKTKTLSGNDNKYERYDDDFNWAGVGGKYFCEIIIPENRDTIRGAYYSSNKADYKDSNAQAFIERKDFEGKEVNDTYYIYVGSRSEKELRRYASAANNGWNFEGRNVGDALSSGGFLGWLESILKWMLELSYVLVHNWGVAIIITTLLLKIILFPLTYKQSIGTLKMQELQPRMKEIQDKYKNNPQKLQEETAKLYQKVGYNPMSGCLPMIFQMMALFAMYNLFNNYFEFRGASFVHGWIDDLSMGDSILSWKANIPFIGNNLRILPIIYLVSQLFYGKITQMNAAGGQSAGSMKFMTYGLPIIFSFLFYNAPSGLLLFWTVSNILQMIQQIVINKVMAKKKAEKAETTSNLKHFTKQGKKK